MNPYLYIYLLPVAFAAPDPDAIQRKMSANDYEGARTRCEKWSASDPDADPALREVCAKADWPLAEARDSARVWQAYCDTWVNTEWAEVAIERLAAATLRELRSPASEDDLLQLALDYPDTRAAAHAREMAADAAVRDASDGAAALRAAQRYPGHPGLPPLVERHPEHFVQVLINDDLSISATISPPIAIPPYMEPMPVWVARWPGGHAEPWRAVATKHLTDAGLTAAQLPLAGSGPALPLCALPEQPDGFHAAVEVRVGAGRVYRPMPWAEGCGPDTPPMVMTVSEGQVVGLSLRADRSVDLSAQALDGRPHTRAFLTETPGEPVLAGPRVFEPVGRVWLVSPLGGGPPWLTDRPPPRDDTIPLSAALIGSGPPPGLKLEPMDGVLTLQAEGQDDWPLPPGEVRFLSPLVQRVLGLDTALNAPADTDTPALRSQVPWARSAAGDLDSAPPTGGQPLALTALSAADIQKAMLRIESAGVGRERLDVRDAWTVDLDKDGVVEVFFRARLDDEGALLVLDVHPTLGNRLFIFRVEDAAPASGEALPPFAFTYGGSPYLAWVGAAGSAGFVELVRTADQGFRSERLVIEP
jgi:hypothetical protein